MTRTTIRSIAAALILTGLAACSGEKSEDDHDRAPAAADAAPGAPAPTGTVIEIKAITDDQGNRFEPANIEARPGDVARIS